MSPDANSLVAAFVAVGAVLVACVAVGFALLAARLRVGSARATDRLVRAIPAVRRDAVRMRVTLMTASDRLDRLRDQWRETDRVAGDTSMSLAAVRGSLERLTRGRLATLIRGAGMVSKVAQFALLWR